MDLIFNKDNKGNEEIKKLLGFLDRSIGYSNMERFFKNATLEVIRLIGKDTYEEIQGWYSSASTDSDEIAQIDALQYSIAVQGYRQYVPSKDVGHTQNGRRMRVDDHEKQAFEWMLDRDNENLERMYYQSLDQLLEILETNSTFTGSDQYKKVKELFVSSTPDFENFFNINGSRLVLLKLQPGLRQCEQQQILPRMGKTDFEALKAASNGKENLLALIKEACVYWALAWGIGGRLTLTVFPEGVLQRFVSDYTTTQAKKPPLKNEYAWAAQQFRKDAEALLLRVENELTNNGQLDPEAETFPDFGFDDSDKFVTT